MTTTCRYVRFQATVIRGRLTEIYPEYSRDGVLWSRNIEGPALRPWEFD